MRIEIKMDEWMTEWRSGACTWHTDVPQRIMERETLPSGNPSNAFNVGFLLPVVREQWQLRALPRRFLMSRLRCGSVAGRTGTSAAAAGATATATADTVPGIRKLRASQKHLRALSSTCLSRGLGRTFASLLGAALWCVAPGDHSAVSALSLPSAPNYVLPVTEAVAATQSATYTESDLSPEEKATVALFERNRDSVVLVTTLIERRDFSSLNIMEVPSGNGSGFIWDKDGHVVTNFHVVRQAEAARVTMADGKTYPARLVGYDADKDVAVLKIDAPTETLRPVTLGSSAGLHVGQRAYAIGNPFGLNETMTQGIISGLGREIRSPTGRPITNVLQTDSAINPGNSGGPLLDSQGRVIGMTTAIYSPSGASAGVGFAIPIDTLKTVVDTLIKYGKVTRPMIGISYLESSQAQILGINEGVLVLDVPQGSEAAKAGLQGTRRSTFGQLELGDIIVGLDGERIRNEADLFRVLEEKKPGQVVTLEVIRGNDPRNLVKLQVKLSSSQ
jgi:S1-C subfamily serine protease